MEGVTEGTVWTVWTGPIPGVAFVELPPDDSQPVKKTRAGAEMKNQKVAFPQMLFSFELFSSIASPPIELL
jgi:hypothetical protein